MNLSEFTNEDSQPGFCHHADPIIYDVYGNPLGTVNPVDVNTSANNPDPGATDYTYQDYLNNKPSFWDTLTTGLLSNSGNIVKALNQGGGSSAPIYQQQNPNGYVPQSQSSNAMLYIGIGIVVLFVLVITIVIIKRK